MQISELKCGESAEISGFHQGNQHYRHQLLALGLTPGTTITLSRIAPLGDPVEIKVRNYVITLRRHEAAILQIRRCST